MCRHQRCENIYNRELVAGSAHDELEKNSERIRASFYSNKSAPPAPKTLLGYSNANVEKCRSAEALPGYLERPN
ncbi:hypothetical protein NDU88_004676 [Pleurodeles waltl]|uniref:Uncharacterized protein n=1 Tax=Pleurodeles waltl TaxID=8319 RepID=A0AAV7UH50_PLEWA|nr:hypothetical protein NDU88_004676 [Pleurodeles waltl]